MTFEQVKQRLIAAKTESDLTVIMNDLDDAQQQLREYKKLVMNKMTQLQQAEDEKKRQKSTGTTHKIG